MLSHLTYLESRHHSLVVRLMSKKGDKKIPVSYPDENATSQTTVSSRTKDPIHLLEEFSNSYIPSRSSFVSKLRPKKTSTSSNESTSSPVILKENTVQLAAMKEACRPPSVVIESKTLLKNLADMLSSTQLEKPRGFSSRFSRKLPAPLKLELFVRKGVPVLDFKGQKITVQVNCPVFDVVNDLEACLRSSSSPYNQFEEWLQWTVEGKMWRFPIDNEQDWEEKQVSFADHTFLDKHIDSELLKCGPIASFMELVCQGLAQNPNFTVEQKRQHLKWYAAYFKGKTPIVEASVREELRLAELEKQARGSSQSDSRGT
ncbi:Mitochondrial ribosomal protein S31 [Paragonimus heterotremus]|uniref:Small ribosomal subunit protein mS31 n=1 Tax=Paragonimus heterotremus TaxID=100268 RepID=A0A8J4SL51_9TREM|nr:Mitochondrial ribosomal protein S31 [Paragonimus heterotremus]